MLQNASGKILSGFARGAFIISLVLVAVLMLTPGDALPETGIWDKSEHALTFAGLSVLGAAAFGEQYAWWVLPSFLIAFGAICEILQIFVPDRSASLEDALANAIGVVTATGVVLLCRFLWNCRRKSA